MKIHNISKKIEDAKRSYLESNRSLAEALADFSQELDRELNEPPDFTLLNLKRQVDDLVENRAVYHYQNPNDPEILWIIGNFEIRRRK